MQAGYGYPSQQPPSNYPPNPQAPQQPYNGVAPTQQYAAAAPAYAPTGTYAQGNPPPHHQQQQQQPQVYAQGNPPNQQPQGYAAATSYNAPYTAAPPASYAQEYPQAYTEPSANHANLIYDMEARDGVRFVWNEWPLNKVEQERAVFKLGALYTPLKVSNDATVVVSYDMIRCKNAVCGGVLNPYALVDYTAKTWGCPLCGTRNAFPPSYSSIAPDHRPNELTYTTIEYQSNRVVGPPVFLFVVDTAVPDEELDELKDSLQQCLTILPPTAMVGLITFGSNVQVHELGFQHQQQQQTVCSKAYVFRGEKAVVPERIFQMLGLGGRPAAPAPSQPGQPPLSAAAAAAAAAAATGQHLPPGVDRFLAPVEPVSSALDQIIEDLRRDPWPVSRELRPQRCTGVALSVAVTMLEKMCAKRGARIVLFMGGPPTVGEGAVAEEKLMVALRSHTDIEKGRATLLKAAKAFYEGLAARCVENCHAVDMFVCSLDQTGLLEMKSCVELTGGFVVLADSFGQSVFKESFRRVFSRHPDSAHESDRGHLVMGLAGTLELVLSADIKVKGAIGPCASLNKKGPQVSENELGQAGTYAWRLCSMDATSTIAFYFDTSMSGVPQSQRYVQFINHYQHANGRLRVRVTTVAGPWQSDPSNIKSIAHSFDQEAAAVCLARIAIYRIESEAPLDVLRFIDRSLIRFSTQFAQYRKNDPDSFALPSEMSNFPAFIFHLRRSPFLQIFNSSPDEAAYHRCILLRESTVNSIVMIMPSLQSYSLQGMGQSQPVLLDAASIRPDTILLLDTFFEVVVFHGENIMQWRESKYQDLPEHAAFRHLLHAPKDDAQVLMQSRIPQPRYIVCDQGKSQARFLMSKVNPSITHTSQDGDAGGQTIFTDDASFQSFLAHLKNIATSGD